MPKPALLSGIQPTGRLHIGNYLGALKNFVELQNSGKYRCFFPIVDYHSMTEDFNPKEKAEQSMNVLLDFLGAGIDPEQSVIFLQSSLPEHTELAWILNTITPLGELKRMTQFKDKSEHAPENINAGLFDYPVLMAADILLYDASFVPVGEDQLQHIELTRTLARKFNGKFGKVFIEPKPLLTEAPRVMSLDNPAKKMSKSHPVGCLFLDDEPTAIREKIKGAVTDSGREVRSDPKNKPAISNLISIFAAFSGKTTKEIELQFAGKGYGDFKKELAELIVAALEPFQTARKKLAKNRKLLQAILKKGNAQASKIASKKLSAVKKQLGLLAIH